MSELYYNYNEKVCPICGDKIKHPYTGEVTIEELEEDSNTCLWIEVINEDGDCEGYYPICRNSNKT